jgi:GTP-binding protein
MKPVIALVGRPNVGKSTLFNCLTRSRDALVADQPGLTRDRKYGDGRIDDREFIVIDTGGLSGNADTLDALMAGQVWQAVNEADIVLFLADARQGVLPDDEEIARRLRRSQKNHPSRGE